MGPHIRTTRSNKEINFCSLQDSDFTLADIAYSLAGTNRYTGYSRINVAWHSVLVSRAAPVISGLVPGTRPYFYVGLLGLLHDAHEAYVGDMSRPLKQYLRSFWGEKDRYGDLAADIQSRIEEALLPHEPDAWLRRQDYDRIVKAADDDVFQREAKALFGKATPDLEQSSLKAFEINPDLAEHKFLNEYNGLMKDYRRG